MQNKQQKKTKIVRFKKQWIIVLLKFHFEQSKKKVKTEFLISIFSFRSVQTNLNAENTKIQTLCKKKNWLKFLSNASRTQKIYQVLR